MLRKLSYIISISYLLLLCSCNTNTKDSYAISIGFSQSVGNDNWRLSMNHAMEVEAALHPEVNLTIYNANKSAKKQINDIEKFITDKVDVIIVSPFESDSIVPVIEKAKAVGIPVIMVDRKANTSNYTAYLGADNAEVGRLAGKYISSISNQNVNVVEIYGDLKTSPGFERSLGFHQIVEQFPRIKVFSIESDDFGHPRPNFIKLLDSLPKIDYVYAFNDDHCLRCMEDCQEERYRK